MASPSTCSLRRVTERKQKDRAKAIFDRRIFMYLGGSVDRQTQHCGGEAHVDCEARRRRQAIDASADDLHAI